MNKTELIKTLMAETDLSKSKAEEVFSVLVDNIHEALSHGDDVSLPGLGVFKVTERAARKGRNPATGETIEIPASHVVKFSPAKGLKDAVNA